MTRARVRCCVAAAAFALRAARAAANADPAAVGADDADAGAAASRRRTAPAEVLYPARDDERPERVLVGIDTTGKPVSVAVVQRLTLQKLGDYSFAVPGPIADVEAAPGSDSEPGLRHDAILWSGFSPARRRSPRARRCGRGAATVPCPSACRSSATATRSICAART